MRLFLVAFVILSVLAVADVHGDAGFCDCYGGSSADGAYWQLLDNDGNPLEDGDWVYAAFVGPNGEIDAPQSDGYPGGDDILLPAAMDYMEYSVFFITVTVWHPGTEDSMGDQLRPTDGDLIYCRIFDGSKGTIGPGNYYADSKLHQLEWKLGDLFFCLFPGDPGKGHTEKHVPGPTAAGESLPEVFDLRQIYPNLMRPDTRLEYGLPADGQVSLKVFDLQGRMVRSLVDRQQGEGWHTGVWDGRDDRGREVGEGIYFCRLRWGDLEKIVRLIRLK